MKNLYIIFLLVISQAFSQQDVASIISQSKGSQIGYSGDSGLKVYRWKDFVIPTETSGSTNYANGTMALNVAGSYGQVFIENEQLNFYVDPLNPNPTEPWNSESGYNYRAETSTAPWNIDHDIGTEEWFGWRYTYGKRYVPDSENDWAMFQCHNGTVGLTPLISLHIASGFNEETGGVGEIVGVNGANPSPSNTYYKTGIFPVAGQSINIVVNVVWDTGSNGIFKVWIDDVLVVDSVQATVLTTDPVGGNAKWGIYASSWRDLSAINASIATGTNHLETSMGTLKIITYNVGDERLGNEYNLVKP